MNRRPLLIAGFVVLTGLAAAGCRSRTNDVLAEADETAIREAFATALKAAAAGDAAAWAAVYAEDAVLLPPHGASVQGREAIRTWIAALPPLSDVRADVADLEGRGDLAYARGSYSMKIAVPGAPAPVDEKGKYLEIWRKQADGSWKLEKDMFNSDLPLPTAAPAPAAN